MTIGASALFNPQVLAQLVSAGFANVPIFFGSGVVAPDFTMPYGPEYLGLSVNIPYTTTPNQWSTLSDATALTPISFAIGNAAGNSTTPETETVLRSGIALDMTTWVRTNPLDPYGEARKQMLLGWAQAMESQLITKATASSGWSSYSLDISSSADPLLNHDAIVSGVQLMGSEGFNDQPVMLAVHSHVFATMYNRKNAIGVPWLVSNPGEVTPTGAKIYRLEPFGTPIYVSDLMQVNTGAGPNGVNTYVSAVCRRNSLALYMNPNLSARSVQAPLTDSQIDALNCYYCAHRYKRLQNRNGPGIVLITSQ